MSALESTEIYLNYVRRVKPYLYDHENNLTQLLTRLFAQAEEQEELDGGGHAATRGCGAGYVAGFGSEWSE